jgi:hypothetical protein
LSTIPECLVGVDVGLRFGTLPKMHVYDLFAYGPSFILNRVLKNSSQSINLNMFFFFKKKKRSNFHMHFLFSHASKTAYHESWRPILEAKV